MIAVCIPEDFLMAGCVKHLPVGFQAVVLHQKAFLKQASDPPVFFLRGQVIPVTYEKQADTGKQYDYDSAKNNYNSQYDHILSICRTAFLA